MNGQIALRMNVNDAPTLGRIRRQAAISVFEAQNEIWLQASHVSEELEAELRSLPGTRYSVLPDDQLVLHGHLVPQGRLPDGRWIELPEWLRVELPPSAFSGRPRRKCPVRIVRSTTPADANVIVAQLHAWQDYAIRAPQIRLDRLSFAMNDRDEAVIRGAPLPAIPGVRYVDNLGVAVEAGWEWTPAVAAEILRNVLELQSGDVALLHASGQWDHIPAEDFVRATRSAVRLSTKERTDD